LFKPDQVALTCVLKQKTLHHNTTGVTSLLVALQIIAGVAITITQG